MTGEPHWAGRSVAIGSITWRPSQDEDTNGYRYSSPTPGMAWAFVAFCDPAKNAGWLELLMTLVPFVVEKVNESLVFRLVVEPLKRAKTNGVHSSPRGRRFCAAKKSGQ